MRLLRRAILTGAAALATAGLMVAPASATPSTPVDEPPAPGQAAPSDVEPSMPDLWRTAPTFESPHDAWAPVGELDPGNNRYDCQTRADTAEFAGRINNWWLRTDDDHGNTGVWVNAVYVSGTEDFEPITGLPPC